jgi:cytochrome c biogenesis protein CcdA
MFKTAVAVVAIALADCVNPSLIGGELFVATGEHPRRQTVAFTLAAWIVTFAFGLALALGLGDLILSLVPKPGSTVKYALITAAGVVLVVGGAGVWLRRRSLVSAEPSDARRESHRPAALMGAGIAGLELLSAFPYFAAIAMIAGSGASDAGKLSLLALYCVIYTVPLIAIAVVIAVMGPRAERILRPAGEWAVLSLARGRRTAPRRVRNRRSRVRNRPAELDLARTWITRLCPWVRPRSRLNRSGSSWRRCRIDGGVGEVPAC